ncbi:hypothetical protein [Oscillatoria acuminata]|uniref:hypothetical protein n=1 Tax=Oscillatoria acuminata TaxID=118323 RepID=UPI0002EE7E01|nr:hypothetical protein [Oscillatoria acuminata]
MFRGICLTSGSLPLARGGLGWGPPDLAKPSQEELLHGGSTSKRDRTSRGWHLAPYKCDRL